MSEIKVEIPPLECPAVLLPTPKNLMDFFGKLATEAEKAALSGVEELKKQGEDLKKILDSVRSILSPYDPDFKAISIPEQEFKIMIQRLIEEFHIYVPTKILELINCLNLFKTNCFDSFGKTVVDKIGGEVKLVI